MVGGLHDFGKANKYFQNYINLIAQYEKLHDASEKRKLKSQINKIKNNSRTNHSLIGSIYILYSLQKQEFMKKFSKNEKNYLSLLASASILRHHGHIKNISSESSNLNTVIKDYTNDKNKVLSDQLSSIDADSMNQIIQRVEAEINKLCTINIKLPLWELFIDEIKQLSLRSNRRQIDGINMFCQNKENAKNFNKGKVFGYKSSFIIQYLYSLLQEADKTSAMGNSTLNRINYGFSDRLNKFYTQKFNLKNITDNNTYIISIRPKIFNEVEQIVDKLSLNERLYSLEAPTGSGKTLSNLVWAFKLRKRLIEETGKIYRIIYILPFTSIIEQTYDILLSILGHDTYSNVLLKHHYLSPVSYNTADEDDNISNEEALFYTEGWNSELIVTTFNQFFHSFLTNNKKLLRKFNKFNNSIIIVDEIQAIPIGYWDLLDQYIPRFLELTSSYMNVSTATMPGIFETKLIPISETGISSFSQINRTKIIYDDICIKPLELIEYLKSNDVFDKKHSFLFVVNTIRSSQQIYNELVNDPFFDDYKIFYLSASIVPKQRISRINEIKKCIDEKQQIPILVSTQVIEAGVDLSFDNGFRDIAPLDSIIQTIGRLNRHGDDKQSNLWVKPLVAENNHKLATYVYDSILISISKEILQEYKIIPENKFREIMKLYYKKGKERKSQSKSREILLDLCEGNLPAVNDLFHLIETSYDRYPVFAPINESAINIWQQYNNIMQIKDWKVKRTQYITIKSKLNQYIINIAKSLITSDIENHGWVNYIPEDLVKLYYDTNFGYTLPTEKESD